MVRTHKQELIMTKEMKDVEIFGVGTWNGFKFVAEDLDELSKNTNDRLERGRPKPKIKLGHSEKQILDGQTDGQPALGSMENFRKNKDKVICDFINIPDIIYEALEKKLYDSVSVELDFIEDFGWFIKAVSLLGADVPAVSNLQDLQVFLTQNKDLMAQEVALCFSEPTINRKVETMTPEEKAELEQLKADKRRLENENATLSTSEKQFKEKERLNLFSKKKTEVLVPFKKNVSDGKLSPASYAKIEKYLDTQQVNFSEEKPDLTIPINLFNELMEEKQINLKETGEDTEEKMKTEDPSEELAIEANKVLMSKPNITYKEAANLVLQTNKKLGKEYAEWTHKCAGGE